MGFHKGGHNQSWSFTRVAATEYRPANPQIKKNLETHEKKKTGDFTKSGEILFFFPNQDQTNPFSIVGEAGWGQLSCYLNITLLYLWSLL